MFLSMFLTMDATSKALFDQPEKGTLIPTVSGDDCFILRCNSLLFKPTL